MTPLTCPQLHSPTAPAGGQQPYMVIEPDTAWSGLSPREVWRFRDLLLTLAGRDIKLRYKQTVLGVAWVVLQPLLAAGVFAFVFGKIARFNAPGGVPYFLFALAGMTAWTAFSGTLGRTTNSMVSNAHVVAKVYFPRIVLPLSTVFSTLIDLAVGLAMLTLMLAIYWHPPGASIWLLPLVLCIMLALAVGGGLWLTALAVTYRDVQYILPVITQILLYASPVAYSLREVPLRYQRIYLLNPLAAPLEALRVSLLGPDSGRVMWGYLAYSAAVAAFVFVCGAATFGRMERKFADVI